MTNAQPRDKGSRDDHPMAGMANLMVHPMAGIAAGSALGLGMVGHVAGMWFGFMAGAMEQATRMGADAPTVPAKVPPVIAREEIARARAQVIELAEAQERRAAARSQKATAQRPATPAVRAPAKPAKKAVRDDLKRITGIGPKLEQVLAARGIGTFAAVAALTADQIAKLEEEFGFPGRIGRDQWVEQARKLAGGRAG